MEKVKYCQIYKGKKIGIGWTYNIIRIPPKVIIKRKNYLGPTRSRGRQRRNRWDEMKENAMKIRKANYIET